jgi:hypothetical protein
MAKTDTATKPVRPGEAEKQAFRQGLEHADTAPSKGKGDALSDDGADKVVKATFSIPRTEYDVIAMVNERCLEKNVVVSRSQVVRAGLALLESVSDRELLEVICKLTKVKLGRPPAKKRRPRGETLALTERPLQRNGR